MEESRTTETNTTSTIKLDGSTSKLVDKGQGELYSPDYAINVNKETTKQGQDKKEEQEIPEGTSGMGLVEASKGVAADITRRNFGAVKERLIENLAAAAVPADALDKTRQFLETFVRDVTLAAQGVTKDAILRIKTHLVDILPSLSPAITRKMVDEAEKEANRDGTESDQRVEEEGTHREPPAGRSGKGDPYMSPLSSMFIDTPLSRL